MPYSCCNPHSVRPCISDHVTTNMPSISYDAEEDMTLYPGGCVEALRDFHNNGVLYVAAGINFITFIIQVSIPGH